MNYKQMMEIAKANGLEQEVNYSYGVCLMAIGSDTSEAREEAAKEALREWDLSNQNLLPEKYTYNNQQTTFYKQLKPSTVKGLGQDNCVHTQVISAVKLL